MLFCPRMAATSLSGWCPTSTAQKGRERLLHFPRQLAAFLNCKSCKPHKSLGKANKSVCFELLVQLAKSLYFNKLALKNEKAWCITQNAQQELMMPHANAAANANCKHWAHWQCWVMHAAAAALWQLCFAYDINAEFCRLHLKCSQPQVAAVQACQRQLAAPTLPTDYLTTQLLLSSRL